MVHRRQQLQQPSPGNRKPVFSRLSLTPSYRPAHRRPCMCSLLGRAHKREKRRVRAEKLSKMTTVVCWDLAPDLDDDQVKDLFHAIPGVVGISFSNTRCRAAVDFATAKDAHMAVCQLTGRCLMGRPLKFAWFAKNSCDINSATLPLMELLPDRLTRTACVEGFDASLSIAQIRCMLQVRFGGQIITPESPDGTSTGEAFVSLKHGKSFIRALEQDGLNLPWHGNKERGAFPAKEKEKGDENVQGGSTGFVQAANWLTPSTGKRIVFED